MCPAVMISLAFAGEALTSIVIQTTHDTPDSQYYVTDPDFGHVPEEILSKAGSFYSNQLNIQTDSPMQEYLTSRARLFDPSRTNPSVVHVTGSISVFVTYFNIISRETQSIHPIQSTFQA